MYSKTRHNKQVLSTALDTKKNCCFLACFMRLIDTTSILHILNLSNSNLFVVKDTICLYTWWYIKRATKLLSTSLPNVDQFSKFFHWHILRTIGDKTVLLKILLHPKRVAALPCKI